MIDAGPPPIIFPTPAIIRPAEHSLLRPGAFVPVSRQERRAIIADLIKTKRMTRKEAQAALFFVPPFGWGSPLADVTVSVDGSGSSTSSTSGGYNFGSKSSAGPFTVVMAFGGTEGNYIDTVTWNGVPFTRLHRQRSGSGADNSAAAIFIAEGSIPSSTLNITTTGYFYNMAFVALSLDNLASMEAVDVDDDSGTLALAALTMPDAGGIRLAAMSRRTGSSQTWVNATEIFDSANEDNRNSGAYDLGLSDEISVSGGSGSSVIVGVSLR